ncbi:hypothetical protein C8A00DRAFT_42576 [Chaetomidium leptoderma]|uniref:LYC1 C-terminal domain-containing protein n=1 Tax=Chaetomidium leptoderma TaxID=669021 RepID=A0AAN6ZWM4_9PEZI|nr:hypothetical protein C8A00DRAFT_42576 [Chaetomidium leptoderma]
MSPPKTQAPPDHIPFNDVVFAEATPQQRVLCWELNGASWAPPMTLEQYVGRETTLSQTALSANGGTKYWILHPKDDPTTIVSACEVTSKRALISEPTTGTREVAAYSIASVFTNPRFRERGMAGHLLRQVQAHVDDDAAGAATECGALYSDIGRAYYTRLGWKDFRSPQVLFTLAAADDDLAITPPSRDDDDDDVPVALLTAEQVAPLCEKDVAAVREAFGRHHAQDAGNKTRVAFLPTAEQLAWHFARDSYVCQTMLGREVVHRGAATADGAAWIYWDHDLREKKLKVLRIVTRGGDGVEKRRGDVGKLLRAALGEAKEWGLPKVLVWSPAVEVTAAATELWRELGPKVQVAFEEREDGSIPSLRWRGGKALDDVVWECNEYYAWC